MGLAEGEERMQLRIGLGRVADQQRLASPDEPEVAELARCVKVAVDVPPGRTRIGVHHEGDPGSPPARFADPPEDLAEPGVNIGISLGVGGIED